MKSYLTPQEREQPTETKKATLRPIRRIKEKINLAWLCRQMGVPKGTFIGWLKRGDNMLQTKNHIPSDYRRKAYRRMLLAVRELRDELDAVYSGGEAILEENDNDK